MEHKARVRFAPSPTGMMHLGNIRTALMNYLFAKKKNGTFIVRIEDTDPSRNFDPRAHNILQDLAWLGLTYDEGPEKNGPYAPYFQSERTALYAKALEQLIEKNMVYRCFCTAEELNKRRARHIALKKPPRYDRTCLELDIGEIQKNLENDIPFVWRFMIDHTKKLPVKDKAHGTIRFEMKNFSDFPLSRSNGSFTFMFANFVDDMLMKISMVIRGEDHLTNTAGQAALFDAFECTMPMVWHLPVLCNSKGKKLSKRDFGFALRDLKDAGFLPEALLNYLAIIGGGSFEHEIMSLEELTSALDFEHVSATGQVKYDIEKLTWVNNKWIDRLEPDDLTNRALPFLCSAYPQAEHADRDKLSHALQLLKTDFSTLKDIPEVLQFYFGAPSVTPETLASFENKQTLSAIISELIPLVQHQEQCIQKAKELAKQHQIAIKELFGFIRVALTGKRQGPSISDLFSILEPAILEKRLEALIDL